MLNKLFGKLCHGSIVEALVGLMQHLIGEHRLKTDFSAYALKICEHPIIAVEVGGKVEEADYLFVGECVVLPEQELHCGNRLGRTVNFQSCNVEDWRQHVGVVVQILSGRRRRRVAVVDRCIEIQQCATLRKGRTLRVKTGSAEERLKLHVIVADVAGIIIDFHQLVFVEKALCHRT